MKFGRLPWLFGPLFAGIGLLVALPCWWFLLLQHYRLNAYLPVKAHVTESRVIRSGRDAYEPILTYSYVVGGRRYDGHRVPPIGNYGTSGLWAWNISSQFPAGADRTAWYSATDPASSFISRGVTFVPHCAATLAFVFILAGGWAFFQSILGRRIVSPPARGRDGWFSLRQEFSNRQAFRWLGALTIAWYGYIAILFGDYLALNRYHFNLLGVVAAVVASALGLIVLVPTWHYWKLSHDFVDARISADRDRFQLGSPVRLRLEQGISRHLVIDELSLGAVCMRSDRVTARNVSGFAVTYTPAAVACNVQKRLAVKREYSPGSQLSAVCEFALPDSAEPSTPPRSSIFPIYQWFIVLQVAAEGQPTLNVRFPIVVENGSRAASVQLSS